MLRTLYVLLLKLHPAVFRQRFGDEMLEIAEHTVGFREKGLLLADAFASLLRQWILRPEYRRPVVAAATPDGLPVFRTIEPYRPHAAVLFHGGILSTAILCAMVTFIGRGGKAPWYVIGAHRPGSGLIPVDRNSLAESDLNTTVAIPEKEDPLRRIAAMYFKNIRVLDKLDADHDLTISSWEIATAPAALRRLDAGRDGKLDAEECGFSLGATPNLPPDFVERARTAFMRENPALATLDADRDGVISSSEIAGGSSALKMLDRDRKGNLTLDELLPDATTTQAALLMMKFDADNDGSISPAERTSGAPDSLLRSADRNRDGMITREEMTNELRLRTERSRQLDEAVSTAAR